MRVRAMIMRDFRGQNRSVSGRLEVRQGRYSLAAEAEWTDLT